MDIVVKGVLDYIQGLEGHKNTVLAGGAPRDLLLGLEPQDYDLVIPSVSPKDIHRLAQSINHEFNTLDMVCKTEDYSGRRSKFKSGTVAHTSNPTCVYGFVIEGKKIDLIGYRQDDDEEFPENVLKTFDFGLNMIYDNGSYVCDDIPNFRNDLDYRTMTLINLPSMSELPKAIKRFNKLNERYKEVHGLELRFQANCLEIIRPQTEKKKLGFDQYNTYSFPVEDTYQQAIPVNSTLGQYVQGLQNIGLQNTPATIQVQNTPTVTTDFVGDWDNINLDIEEDSDEPSF